MKIVKNKATGEVISSLPKLVTTTIEGILVIDIESKIWLITNNTALNVTDQFDILTEEPTDPEVTDKCNLVLVFNNYHSRVLEGDYNSFSISVSGNSIYNVEFKSSLENWKLGSSLNTVIIKVPASGNKEDIIARIKGCTKEFKYSVDTLPSLLDPLDGLEEEIGTIKFSESTIFKFIVKRVDNIKWLLQTDDARSYYLPRGLNILKDSRVTVDKTKVVESELSNDAITAEGGLQPFINDTIPSRWSRNWWESRGYTLQNNGEWKIVGNAECVDSSWTTIDTKCENGVSKILRRSNCGTTEWINGGTACQGECVDSTWTNELDASNNPIQVCDNGVSKIRQKSNCGNFRLVSGGNGCSSNTGTTISNSLVLSPEETKKNWVSWENFQGREVSIPKGHDAVLGFGSPIFSNDPTASDGKTLLYLKLGYTHACNLTAFPKHLGRYKEENIYLFTQPFQLIQYAALAIIQNINRGSFSEFYPNNTYTSSGVWGDLERLALPNSGTDYRGITYAGAVKLGEYMFYSRAWGLDPSTADLQNKDYNINQNKCWLMLDDEQIPYALGGIGKMSFLAGINEGIKNVAPDVKPVWYAVPMSFFFQTNQKAELITDSMIQNELLNGALDYNHIGFKSKGFWFDSGVYVKVPTITSHNKYVKDSKGAFVIQDGKRVWNKEDFTEIIYGEETKFLGEPDDQVKYLLYRESDGAALLGPQYWNGVPNSPSPKQEYLNQGFTSWGRPNMGDWKPETQLNTDFHYGFANVIMQNLILGSRVEFNNTDISKYRSSAKVLNYVELRLKTEEFTAGGNSIYSRQIGAGLLTFCQLFSYLSGIRAVSLWENGKDYGYNLPPRGTQLYPESGNQTQRVLENWSGLTHRTDALVKMCEDLNGSNPDNWTYIHFTYPVVIQNRQGVISSGIYTGNKFVFVMINPTLNYDELQEVTLKIANTDYKVILNGNGMPHYGVINLANGLSNNDFSLSYTTIYGRNIIVSGKVNGNINDSVISGL